MIEKIISIRDIGKFENCKPSGDVVFKKVTLLFGENARGKSTLSAILRSLQSGDPNHIEERRRLGGVESDPRVELLVDDHGKITYSNRLWTQRYEDIVIFDEKFVIDNVYSGDAVGSEHRLNLHRFALGEQSVALANAVVGLTERISGAMTAISESRKQIEAHIVGNIDVAAFVGLKPVTEVEKKLKAKLRETEALKKAADIKKQDDLAAISIPNDHIEDVRAVLAKTLAEVSLEAERDVHDHAQHHMNEGNDAWLEAGVGHIQGDDCPFCGQSLAGIQLISAYREYFSEAYAALKSDIRRVISQVEETLDEQHRTAIASKIEINRLREEFWNDHIEIETAASSAVEDDAPWITYREELLSLLRLKEAAPLEPREITAELTSTQSEFGQLLAQYVSYNKRVVELNATIAAKKTQIQGGDLLKAQSELERLKNEKARHSESVGNLCETYMSAQALKQDLEKEKAQAREQLMELTGKLVEKYGAKVNEWLEKFGADFSIANFKETYPAGKPRLEYRISIRGEAVNLTAKDNSQPGPDFGNTLSSGDKTTLAFAFFMGRILGDQDLAKKVVVFDDPLSSLDDNRRTQTRQAMVRVAQRAAQSVVLSNDPQFLRLLRDEKAMKACKVLQITGKGETSSIVEWDIEKDTDGDYLRNFNTLLKFVDGDSEVRAEDAIRCLRPLLEYNLRVRFPGDFDRTDTLGGMIKKIEAADKQGRLACLKPASTNLSEMNGYATPDHHAANATTEGQSSTDTELKSYIQRALLFCRGISET